MDVPDVALDMMRLFVYGGPNAFSYSPQNLNRAVDHNDNCPTCPMCDTNDKCPTCQVCGTSGDCPTCPTCAIGTDGGSSNSSLYVGLALGFAMLFFAGVLVLRRSRSSKHTAAATYDLEMRGGTYFDDPNTEGDGNENAALSNGGKLH